MYKIEFNLNSQKKNKEKLITENISGDDKDNKDILNVGKKEKTLNNFNKKTKG